MEMGFTNICVAKTEVYNEFNSKHTFMYNNIYGNHDY